MTRVLVISDRNDLAQSVGRYLRFREGIEVASIIPPSPPQDSARTGKVVWVPQTFRKLAAWIEAQARVEAGDASLCNTITLIDVPSLNSLEELDPIDRTEGWRAVVGMLVLAFPEIHWALVSPFKPADEPLRRAHFPQTATLFEDLGHILEMSDDGFSPLLDPACFREEIRRHLKLRGEAAYVPLRWNCAAAIDEEENYSYFNAYVAYRFGFRCHVITSHRLMDEVLRVRGAPSIELTFEDVYLNFPDKQRGLSKIALRDKEFRALRSVSNRVFVTGGHKRTSSEQETWRKNDNYLSKRKARKYYHKMMFKPESGVFDVWARSGLRQRFLANGGKAPGYIWPPAKVQAASEGSGTHSAPGRLLLISEVMIRRAGRILLNAETVRDAVQGAVLALDAEEYLGHRTPTTSLEAVSLKHQLEVRAECMFYGVEYHLDTRSRFQEIRREVESIGTWFLARTRAVSILNAEIGILSELILGFRVFNQFSEEQAALSKARHLHRRIWFERHKSWAWLFYPARWYFDHLLSSLPIFVAALVGWVLTFGGVYSLLLHWTEKSEVPLGFLHGFGDSVVAFFGMQPPHDFGGMEHTGGPAMVCVTLIIIILSFVHLGIFVSHLYSIIARR